jgi:hypothetical protein
VAASLGLVPIARAGWSRPVQLAPPASLDIVGPQVAFSPAGAAGVGFTVQDEDNPATSSPYASWRNASGRVSAPRRIPGAEALLGLAWFGRSLQLLVGDSPTGQACCSTASVLGLTAAGRFGPPRRLVSGLAGATAAQLVALGHRMLAAVATERGVWISQTSGSGRWATHRLAGAGVEPQGLDATALPRGRTAVAWIGGGSNPVGSRSLFIASGSSTRALQRGRAAITVAASHGIDEAAIAAGPGGATAAWIESWYDRRGNYHSEVATADLAHPRHTTTFAVSGTIASGLAFGADAHGDQVIAWMACTWSATCSVRAVVRSGGKSFGRPVRLGSIDATEAPTVAVSSGGDALAGWIAGGHVLAAELRPHATRFLRAHVVSSTTFAANLSLTFGPAGAAIAAWSQGTLAPDVVGAVFRR